MIGPASRHPLRQPMHVRLMTLAFQYCCQGAYTELRLVHTTLQAKEQLILSTKHLLTILNSLSDRQICFSGLTVKYTPFNQVHWHSARRTWTMTFSLVSPIVNKLTIGWRPCPLDLSAKGLCNGTGIWNSFNNATIQLHVSSLNVTTAYSLRNSSILSSEAQG